MPGYVILLLAGFGVLLMAVFLVLTERPEIYGFTALGGVLLMLAATLWGYVRGWD